LVIKSLNQVLVAHAYNPGCLGGQDQEDHNSRPVQGNSSQTQIITKITRAKAGQRCGSNGRGLLCKCQALSSNSSPPTKKKKKKNEEGREEGRVLKVRGNEERITASKGNCINLNSSSYATASIFFMFKSGRNKKVY
jgi:hypothetical protein